MKNTYTIRNLIALLISKLWFIIVVTVVFGLCTFCAAEFVMPEKYESYTTMYVKNNNAVSTEQENNVDLNDLNASKSLASTYITVLKSNAVMEQVGVRLLENYDENTLSDFFKLENGTIRTDDISECFSMTAVDETEVIRIMANTKNPEISADMCNIVADIAPNFLIRVVGAGSVEIIDTAVPDSTPVSPNILLTTLIGLLIGFSLSVFIVLLIDFFDDSVKEAEELSQKFDKAVLGEVQCIENEKNKGKKKKGSLSETRVLLTDKDIPFNALESYKSIRTNILFSLGTSDKKIIAVSSANPNEGKSTIAANIAIALAQTDSSVLLIDADMRKPVQHKIFKVKNAEGLSTLIIQKSTIEESVKSNMAGGLSLLPSGPMPPNPSELLASERFKELLEKFSQEYDYVIIDTPPVNLVSDAMVMKDSISGILLVVKYADTTYEDVSDSMKQIGLAKANMLGFVLNAVHHKHGIGYYKYKYKDYGYDGYGSTPPAENSEDAYVD